jgi:hypothetical protein
VFIVYVDDIPQLPTSVNSPTVTPADGTGFSYAEASDEAILAEENLSFEALHWKGCYGKTDRTFEFGG